MKVNLNGSVGINSYTQSSTPTLKMSASDRGYSILLSHLHNPATKLAVSTIQGALAYQLANVSPLPTPLAALTVSSPFYLSQPFTYPKLHSLCTAFRHATHIKYRVLSPIKADRQLGRSLGEPFAQLSVNGWLMY
jgi:hypothetical protein